MEDFTNLVNSGETNFTSNFDDSHFHRSYYDNISNILNAEKQLS